MNLVPVTPAAPVTPSALLQDLKDRLGILGLLTDQVEAQVTAARRQHEVMAERIAALEAKLGGK